MTGKVFRAFFWTAYDHIGKLAVVNVLWCASLVVAYLFALVHPAGLLPGLVLIVLATGGLVFFTGRLVTFDDARIVDFFKDMCDNWTRILAGGLTLFGIAAVLFVNAYFYAVVLTQYSQLAGMILSGIFVWALIVYATMAGYVLPLMTMRRHGARSALKYAFLLTVDNLRLSVALMVASAVIVALSAGTFIGLFLVGAALPLLLYCVAYRVLEEEYERRERAAAGEEPANEEDRFAGRGWREFIRPWEV